MIEGFRRAVAPGVVAATWLVLLLALPASILAEEPDATDAVEPATQPVEAESEAVETEALVDVEASEIESETEPQRSPGMYLPFDGSSTEAFEGSLDNVKADVTDAEFVTLLNALDYLLVYDLGARGDPELLYQRLDGKTPDDVLGMVKWRQEGLPRVRGRTKP